MDIIHNTARLGRRLELKFVASWIYNHGFSLVGVYPILMRSWRQKDNGCRKNIWLTEPRSSTTSNITHSVHHLQWLGDISDSSHTQSVVKKRSFQSCHNCSATHSITALRHHHYNASLMQIICEWFKWQVTQISSCGSASIAIPHPEPFPSIITTCSLLPCQL